jgi:hypothetical protein
MAKSYCRIQFVKSLFNTEITEHTEIRQPFTLPDLCVLCDLCGKKKYERFTTKRYVETSQINPRSESVCSEVSVVEKI